MAIFDFEYETGKPIGEQINHNNIKLLKDWAGGADLVITKNLFFNVPWQEQMNLQEQHPGLKEIWDQYLTMLHLAREQK